MINIFRGNEAREKISEFTNCKNITAGKVEAGVKEVITRVKSDGDAALDYFARKFGDQVRESFLVTQSELKALAEQCTPEAKEVIERAAASIREFAEGMQENFRPVVQKRSGYSIGLDFVPIEKAACYVPGGRFPLPSTALMTVIPARVAGVKEVFVVSPSLTPEVAFAALVAGADSFYCLGGAQAVAAFAFGTETIPRADIIVGPGNAWVTEAKKQLQGQVGIDMLAGPSEVAIIADESASSDLVTLDILAQAEHDPDARAWLLTDSEKLALEVQQKIPAAVARLKLPDFVKESLQASAVFLLKDLNECVDYSNLLAPEHLHINTAEDARLRESLKHFGSLFIGANCTVPFGDYLAGPNHTLPTGSSARFSSGLSPLTFMRTQTWTRAEGDVAKLAADVNTFARLEGLLAHAAAAEGRI